MDTIKILNLTEYTFDCWIYKKWLITLPQLIISSCLLRLNWGHMWINLRFLHLCHMDKFENAPHVEKLQISPHLSCLEIWNFSTWQIFSPQIYWWYWWQIWGMYWLSTDFYWHSTYFYRLSTDFYWFSTDSLPTLYWLNHYLGNAQIEAVTIAIAITHLNKKFSPWTPIIMHCESLPELSEPLVLSEKLGIY